MWFDYQKAFNSVPHKQIIKALEFTKVPNKILNAVLHLIHCSTEIGMISYITDMLSGGYLSLMLFILSVNQLPFLLSLLTGYNIGKPNSNNPKLTHLFFADGLKTFARNKKEATLQLDLIT